MKKVLTAKDAQAFNDDFHVFNLFGPLDLMLLNMIGLGIFLCQGVSKIFDALVE